MQYYGTKLTENISRREPEGYLLCLNVPVARTGTQDYLPEELSLPPGSFSLPPDGLISVYRPPDEVFSPETIASFQGMPVTDDHPEEGVDIENIRKLGMGHAHNIRRGTGEESDLLLADLIITDARLIDRIMNQGKREISCGYTYELCEENGQYIQRKIRGNHIAVVDAGRAGHRVSIKDEQASKSPIWETPAILQPPVNDECNARSQSGMRRSNHKTNERSPSKMKKSLTKLLARMAKDGDIETVAEIIEELIGEEADPSEEAAVAAVTEPIVEAVAEIAEATAVETPASDPAVEIITEEGNEITVDESTLADIVTRLDRIIELLTPAAPAADPVTDEDPDDLPEELAEVIEEALEAVQAEEEAAPNDAQEEVAALVEEILEPEVSTTLEDPDPEEETSEEDCGGSCRNGSQDALRAALTVIRPILRKMPKKQRRKVCADIAARVNSGTGSGTYAALAGKVRSADPNPRDLGKKIMESRNLNYRKGA